MTVENRASQRNLRKRRSDFMPFVDSDGDFTYLNEGEKYDSRK